MTARPRSRRSVALVVGACLALLTGCGGAGGSEQGSAQAAGDQQTQQMPAEQGGGRGPETRDAWEEQVRGEQPEWVENVFPPPGSESASVNKVEISHTAVAGNQGVRLVIDGVDVTAFSEPGQGRLAYEPADPRAPVEFGPGLHRATAVRVELDERGQPHEVIDRFGWTFTVL